MVSPGSDAVMYGAWPAVLGEESKLGNIYIYIMDAFHPAFLLSSDGWLATVAQLSEHPDEDNEDVSMFGENLSPESLVMSPTVEEFEITVRNTPHGCHP